MAQEKCYVDVNVFVYWLGNHPKFGETARKWIQNIETSPIGQYVTSSLSLYEATVIMAGLTGKNLKDKVFTEQVVKSMTEIKGLVVEPITCEDFVSAIDLMNDYTLDYEDALHLAVAIRTGATAVISNDKHFASTPIHGIFKL